MDATPPRAEEPLTVANAVRTIERMSGLDDVVRRRAEGMTWMVWGIVTACAAMFYAFADYYTRTVTGVESRGGPVTWHVAEGPAWSAYMDFAWPLWFVVGGAATIGVWRIAAVTLPRAAAIVRRILVAVTAAVVAFLAAWLLVVLLGADVRPHVALALLGLPWLALAGLDVFRTTATGRRAMLAIGGALVVLGLLSAPLVRGLHPAVYPGVELLAIVMGGGVPFAVGFWQALRG